MKKLLIPIIAFLVICINVTAQEKSRKEKRGDKYYFVYSYDKAIDSYTHSKQLTTDGQRKLAASYHMMSQNIQSVEAYAKLVSAPEGVMPEDYFNYSMALKTNGNYDLSGKWMDKFAELKPEDLRAKDYTEHKGEYINYSADAGKYTTANLNINTDAEDFGICYFKNKIVFASSGANPDLMRKTYNGTGKPFLNIYVSEVEAGQFKSPEKFNTVFNGKMHEGPASFNKEGNYMAFTRNNYDMKRKELVVRVEICFSSFKDGNWSKPEPFALNSKEYSVGHPCLSADGKTMYFSSDMPGGFGGADIYRTRKDEKGNWGKSENLGNKMNTEGDELFPFYAEKNDIVFFTSNGRFGLGGLDIFIGEIKGSGFGRIYNAGFPLNSQYDDFAAIVNDSMTHGYFSSNRSGGIGGDDIYSVDILTTEDHGKKIVGIAKDKNEKPISEALITLSILDANGKVVETRNTNNDGAFAFYVDSGKNFKLTGTKENYLEGNSVASTFGKEFIVNADVTLLQNEEPVVKKEEIILPKPEIGADLGKKIELNPIYFDYKKFNIRPDAEIELEKIAKIMNDNPFMIVELSSHTDCRATKGFNQILSGKRASASAHYIKSRITKPERIYGKGYGETMAVNGCACEGTVVSDCSEEEFQKDRRTEFIVVKDLSQSSK